MRLSTRNKYRQTTSRRNPLPSPHLFLYSPSTTRRITILKSCWTIRQASPRTCEPTRTGSLTTCGRFWTSSISRTRFPSWTSTGSCSWSWRSLLLDGEFRDHSHGNDAQLAFRRPNHDRSTSRVDAQEIRGGHVDRATVREMNHERGKRAGVSDILECRFLHVFLPRGLPRFPRYRKWVRRGVRCEIRCPRLKPVSPGRVISGVELRQK